MERQARSSPSAKAFQLKKKNQKGNTFTQSTYDYLAITC